MPAFLQRLEKTRSNSVRARNARLAAIHSCFRFVGLHYVGSAVQRRKRDAIERLVSKYGEAAAAVCPTLSGKHVTPHILRHTTAVSLLRAGNDRAVIALWLGHATTKSTQPYLHADLKLKEQALARTAPNRAARARFQPDDELLAFLERL